MNLASTQRCLKTGFPQRVLGQYGPISKRHRHSCCALSSEGLPCAYSVRTVTDSQEDSSYYFNDTVNPRLPWHTRLHAATLPKWSKRSRIPFSGQPDTNHSYVPFAQELLRGLWSLGQESVWLHVDDLVVTGEPDGSLETWPEFSKWKHVAMASNYSDAISTLVSQGNLRYQPSADEQDEEYEQDGQDGQDDMPAANQPTVVTVPTWLVAFILATMLHTRAAAYEGLAFCLSQLDATPRHLRASLLLLSMCSLSAHRVVVQVPVLLGAFHDVFDTNQTAEHADGKSTDPAQYMGSRDTVMYQYNVLLTLLCQFPRVPGFAQHTIRLLQHMDASDIALETETATQLIAARFASEQMVHTVRDILERQGIDDIPEQSDELAVALMRFYSKRANQAEAARYSEVSHRIHPSKHVRTYLSSFRDVAACFAYVQAMRAQEHQRDSTVTIKPKENDGIVNHLDTSTSVPEQTVSTTSLAGGLYGVPKRHIYTALLRSAAVSQTISATTFLELFNTIRETSGDNREIETVALSGMLKRHAWDHAKDLWHQWQITNRSIRSILREIGTFIEKRERIFGDSSRVRRTLGWTKLTERVTYRRMKMLSVDANALAAIVRAIGGPKPDSLSSTFKTMDDYAIKMNGNSGAISAGSDLPDSLQPNIASSNDPSDERIRLTSRVINCFMVRAMYFRRPDVVFRLWDEMTSYYGVDSSAGTFVILLRSARLATSMETSLSKFVPRWMMGSGGFLRGKVIFPDLSEEILWMLRPDYSPNVSWNGASPWRVARRVFREEFILANWPWLRTVEVPARPIRRDNAIGQVEALKELTMDRGLWGTKIRKIGKYPHIFPTLRMFKEYIIMLSRVQHSSEIPEVLAWIRALNIPPSRRILSICLASWSQVGLDSLADDAWNEAEMKHLGGNNNQTTSQARPAHGGEYDKLLAWIEDWVGEENVPDESDVLQAFRYIKELEEKETFLY